MTPKQLAKLIKRRHPEYAKSIKHWEFLELCYSGDREWFNENIFQYLKEGPIEFKDRIRRAYRFNHSKEIVDLVGKYIFKSKIYRNDDSAPVEVADFWKKSNKNGKSPIEKFIREVAKQSSIFGRVWIVVDNDRITGNPNPREYAYIVKPQHVLDMSYDDNDELNWILIAESSRDDSDPIESTGEITARYRLWTRDSWFLVSSGKRLSSDVAEEIDVELIASGDHNLGVVPVFSHDHNDCEELYKSPSLICDIAYLDRACANYLSNLDAIIQDQTFSQLAIPAQGLLPGADGYDQMVEMGSKRIFTYDGEGGSQPFFLSPDPRQAELIITAVSKIINEIYHTVGMAGERTKSDNSVGIDNSSGVAKAYDFERVNALLATKAAALRRAEIKMCELVMMWNGTYDESIDIGELIVYPETFDVRGVADEFSIASNLILVEAPLEMKKEQFRNMVEKIFPRLDETVEEKMYQEIDDMTEESFLMTMGAAQKPTSSPVNPGKKGNTQGENNKESE